MYLLLLVFLAIAATVGVGQVVERRRRGRIRELIAGQGGKVTSITLTAPVSSRRVVRYVGPQGEVREALASPGRPPTLCDDRPLQLVLREDYERMKPDGIGRLILAAETARLPGFDAYASTVRELAEGLSDSVSIEESAPAGMQANRRFAPLLQCVEAASICCEPGRGQILELTVDGKKVDVAWSVHGEPPHRSLSLAAVRPRV